MSGKILAAALALLAAAAPAAAQSALERSPNVLGVWTLRQGTGAFAFAHRFETRSGGDELFNIPTMTLAFGLPLGVTLGLDYSSNSEIEGNRGGNETQYWAKRGVSLGRSTTLAATAAYNTGAESVDGALSVRQRLGMLSLFGEGRAFSDLFGTGEGGLAGTVGAALHLTPYLALTGDLGRSTAHDSIGAAWSAAVAMAIPGSPHTFSLQATNAGSVTLQGASRERPEIYSGTRYGFVFTAPLGTPSQWARIFRPGRTPAAAPSAPAARRASARVEIRDFSFGPAEIRIRAGESVEWVNGDAARHDVTGEDGGWRSPLLAEGESWVQTFDRAGSYPYYCSPHPQMTGVVIVEG